MAKKSKKTVVSVNMKGVEGKGVRTKPGEYLAEVSEATLEDGPKAKYIKWEFDLDDGGKAWFNTSLAKNSLWNLRGLLEAMGEDVPDDEMDIDLEDLKGKRVGIVIELEEYEGKKRSKMVDYFSEDDFEGEVKEGKDEDKKSSKKDKKKKKSKGDDKLMKSDVEDLDRDALLELNTEHELELDEDDYKDNGKGNKKLLADVLEKLDEKDLLDDGEGEKDDKKGKKGKKGKKEAEKLERSAVEDMDQDELADVIKEHKLDVDLDDHKKLKNMTKAVLEALESEDLLED